MLYSATALRSRNRGPVGRCRRALNWLPAAGAPRPDKGPRGVRSGIPHSLLT